MNSLYVPIGVHAAVYCPKAGPGTVKLARPRAPQKRKWFEDQRSVELRHVPFFVQQLSVQDGGKL